MRLKDIALCLAIKTPEISILRVNISCFFLIEINRLGITKAV